MARLTVQAFERGKPIGEWVAKSDSKSEQEMADWMQANRRRPTIEFRFLGMDSVIVPRVTGNRV